MAGAQMIDEGHHRAHPVRAILGEASTGAAQIAVQFVLPDINMAEIVWYGSFSDKARDRTLESLRYCGWESDDLAEAEIDVDGQTMYGPRINQEAVVQLVIEHQEYPEGSGKWRPKVAWVNKGSGPVLKQPLVGPQAKRFAEQMRAAAAASRAKAGVKTAPAGELKDDHIPF